MDKKFLKPNSKALLRSAVIQEAIKRIETVSKRVGNVDYDMLETALEGLRTIQNEINKEWSVDGYLKEMGVSE